MVRSEFDAFHHSNRYAECVLNPAKKGRGRVFEDKLQLNPGAIQGFYDDLLKESSINGSQGDKVLFLDMLKSVIHQLLPFFFFLGGDVL